MGKFEKKSDAKAAPVGKRKGKSSANNAKKNNKLPLLLGIGGAVLILIGCLVGFWIMNNAEQTVAENYIIDNAYIAGVDVGGMNREEAADALRAAFGADAEATQISYGEKLQDMDVGLYTNANGYAFFTTTYDPAAQYDTDHYGNPIENAQNPVAEPDKTEDGRTLDEHMCIPATQVSVSFDLQKAIDAAYRYGREIEADGKTRIDVDFREGLTIDNETYIDEWLQRFAEEAIQPAESTVNMNSKTHINDEEGNPVEVDCVEIVLGTVGRQIDTAALKEAILRAYMNLQFSIEYDYQETYPAQIDLDQIFLDAGCVAPVDAYCSDKQTLEIVDEVIGKGFLMQDAYAQLANAVSGDTVILPLMQELLPKRNKEQVLAIISEESFPDVLATYDSPHVYNPVRTHNLELACQAIDGTILAPGAVFSFNDIVGERTAAKGYGAAAVYVGGRTEDQLGGGVCQVASTIYWCTLKADLEVVERAPHRYVPSYVPWGMDATIYWRDLDYKFRNNTAYPIRIDASVSDGYVHITLVGTETKDYTVKLFYEIQNSKKSGVKTIYIHPDMSNYASYASYKHGETIQTAYDGYTVYTYMQKLDADGNVISTTRVNISEYKSRDKEVAYLLDPSIPMKDQVDSDGNLIEVTKPTEPSTEPSTEPTTEPTESTEPSTEPPEPTESTEPSTEPTEPTEPSEPET